MPVINKSDKGRDIFLPNKTKSANGQTTIRNETTYEVRGGPATGGGSLFVRIESVDLPYTTVAAETDDAAAANAAAAWQALLDAAYGPAAYIVSNPSAPSPIIKFQKTNGNMLWIEDHTSTDATQFIDEIQGPHHDCAMLHEAQTAGDGKPNRYEDGFEIQADIPTADRSTIITLHAMLTNVSGAPLAVDWRVWWWFDLIGWVQDQEVGVRTVSETGGFGIQEDTIQVSAAGATKVAVELVSTTPAIASRSWLNVIGLVSN